jgi:ATPase subunit of ABC transporter with duplicated ATPase domains
MLKKTLLASLLLTASVAAFAQSPAAPAQNAAPALTAQQQAQMTKQNQQMAQNSLQIARMIDNGQAGAVWDQASSVAKQSSSRGDFVDQVTADRAEVGKAGERKLAAITRTQSKGGEVPAGQYINVSYATQFSKGQKPVRELISYHLDNDRVWRLTGYTLR